MHKSFAAKLCTIFYQFARAFFQYFPYLPTPKKIFKKLLTTALFYGIIYIETEEVIAMKKLLGFIAIILILWFIISIVDIDIHNMTTQTYWKYNMFTKFMEVIGK